MRLGSGVAVPVVRMASAVQIRPLAWKLPYAAGVALKKKRKKEKKKLSCVINSNSKNCSMNLLHDIYMCLMGWQVKWSLMKFLKATVIRAS